MRKSHFFSFITVAPALLAASAYGTFIGVPSSQSTPYTVSNSDLLENATPVTADAAPRGVDSSASGGLACLTDGTAPSSASTVVAVGQEGVYGGYNAGYEDFIYNFSSPIELGALNLYFYWSDNGRNNPPGMSIYTSSSTLTNASDPSWGSPIGTSSYYSSPNLYSEISFANGGALIAGNVESLEITFGDAENGWVGLGEIDAIAGVPEPASLSILALASCAGLLRRRARKTC